MKGQSAKCSCLGFIFADLHFIVKNALSLENRMIPWNENIEALAIAPDNQHYKDQLMEIQKAMDSPKK